MQLTVLILTPGCRSVDLIGRRRHIIVSIAYVETLKLQQMAVKGQKIVVWRCQFVSRSVPTAVRVCHALSEWGSIGGRA